MHIIETLSDLHALLEKGVVTAAALIANIGDVRRFGSANKLARFAGANSAFCSEFGRSFAVTIFPFINIYSGLSKGVICMKSGIRSAILSGEVSKESISTFSGTLILLMCIPFRHVLHQISR